MRRHQRRLSDSSLKGFPVELHNHEDAGCHASPSKQSCPDPASELSPVVPAGVGVREEERSKEVCEVREEPVNEGPSIDGSTDTLVNEAGQQSSSQGGDDVLQRTEPELLEMPPPLLEHQLSNTASTSTTDLRSSAGVILGGDYPELSLEEVAPGKCVVCLSRKNGQENLLAASRSSLARSPAAATANGGRFSHYSTPMHSRTPSSGFPATPCDDRLLLDPMASRTQSSQASCPQQHQQQQQQQQQFDVDGLNTPMDALQQRIHQMVLDHEAKIENLEHELRRARFALDQRSLHHNSKEASDALEDAVSLLWNSPCLQQLCSGAVEVEVGCT